MGVGKTSPHADTDPVLEKSRLLTCLCPNPFLLFLCSDFLASTYLRSNRKGYSLLSAQAQIIKATSPTLCEESS